MNWLCHHEYFLPKRKRLVSYGSTPLRLDAVGLVDFGWKAEALDFDDTKS